MKTPFVKLALASLLFFAVVTACQKEAEPDPIPYPEVVADFAHSGVYHTFREVKFDASWSKNIETCKWDFGDGKGASIPGQKILSVSHIYTKPGTYNVTLTVTGKGGTDKNPTTNTQSRTFAVVIYPSQCFIEGVGITGFDCRSRFNGNNFAVAKVYLNKSNIFQAKSKQNIICMGEYEWKPDVVSYPSSGNGLRLVDEKGLAHSEGVVSVAIEHFYGGIIMDTYTTTLLNAAKSNTPIIVLSNKSGHSSSLDQIYLRVSYK